MSLRDELSVIYSAHGMLTPAIVVDIARPVDHPLHERFDWDNETAGEAWRREQARQLIRSVRLVYREATDTQPALTVRAFASMDTPDGRTYRPVEEIVADPMSTQILRRDMERAWRDMKRRYAEFDEFWRMVASDVDGSVA